MTELYALIEISNQMLEDSAFDHAGASLRKTGLALVVDEMLKRRSRSRNGSVVAQPLITRPVPITHWKGLPRS